MTRETSPTRTATLVDARAGQIPALHAVSAGTALTAGVGGVSLVGIAKALAIAEPWLTIVMLASPALSTFGLWIWPHIRVRMLIRYYKSMVEDCRRALLASKLDDQAKQNVDKVLHDTELLLLKWRMSLLPGIHDKI